jgi:hypothetical protein
MFDVQITTSPTKKWIGISNNLNNNYESANIGSSCLDRWLDNLKLISLNRSYISSLTIAEFLNQRKMGTYDDYVL